MTSSKQGMRTKPLRNDEDIVEFMLETDDELSDLSDSDFEDIMKATDVSSDEALLSDMNENLKEPPQSDPDTAGPSTPKKRPRRPRPNNVKYNELCWTSTELPQPMSVGN